MLGMADSHFVTPSGLHSPDHYTTAEDMAKLAAPPCKTSFWPKWLRPKIKSWSMGILPIRVAAESQPPAVELPGAIGLKTGYTDAAGRCLVSAVRREDVTLIVVTLGCPDDFICMKSCMMNISPKSPKKISAAFWKA
jgi:D-alanyl-D-alanine carboxypeptidase/D-alanyl-D-alanine carboxypeptidase (penicillin-binding protein 5/6)